MVRGIRCQGWLWVCSRVTFVYEEKLCMHWNVWLRRMVASRDASNGTWCQSYPHKFLGLLSECTETQERVLSSIREDFILLEDLERKSHDDH